ncbi:MAG: hypothetical protein H0U54_01510 [Acidobacteria bacterium]|nr:hypothetical protein [Acidobacteriota bacterium]
MNARDSSRNGESAPHGTRQRISDCRKRLRQTRAMQRALRIEQDEAVLAASSLLTLTSESADLGNSEDASEDAGASPVGTTRRYTPEVDRRARLRAR